MPLLARTHAFLYRRGLARRMGKMQTVLLTTTGRKSGRTYTVPLGAIPDGDDWVVIGSNSGNAEHPNWWLNLSANPQATLVVGDRTMKVRMQEITDPTERQQVWARVVGTMKRYAGYESKTSRVIPLARLRPVA